MAIVFTPGVQGSASTWAYNVCRELFLLQNPSVIVLYSDSGAELAEQLSRVEHAAVVKMHQPDDDIIAAIHADQVPAIVTVRDPRDSIVSLMERFGYSFERSLGHVIASTSQIAKIQSGVGLRFQYESGFFNHAQSVAEIAEVLRIPASAEQCEEIFSRYSSESVRAFVKDFESLPEERKVTKNGSTWDANTMIHRTHIGDGAVGKWKERLSPSEQNALAPLSGVIRTWGY